ncbi:MAG TPA: DCC1-like thiol-disulfide oxidoreductase family protein [Pyrinomonadaceae bacterium]|jgi:predicted DCC family thiol-disulfide oxidoreductase YuxK|nr:DCC1-like thiol-disulfide oxidoreductase family protein [Pyrinomonadaceae bacterium]
MVEDSAGGPVVLYDGVCGFCNHAVQLILKYDRRGVMRFAALQSDYARGLLERHPELRGLDTVVLVENVGTAGERVYVKSSAALRIARHLGGFWKVFLLGRALPAGLRDYLYDQFARRRYKWFGKRDACMLPPPDVRARFLDA